MLKAYWCWQGPDIDSVTVAEKDVLSSSWAGKNTIDYDA